MVLYPRSLFIFYLPEELFEGIVFTLLWDCRFYEERGYSWFIFTCPQRSWHSDLWTVSSQGRVTHSWKASQFAHKIGKIEVGCGTTGLFPCLFFHSFLHCLPCARHCPKDWGKTGLVGVVLEVQCSVVAILRFFNNFIFGSVCSKYSPIGQWGVCWRLRILPCLLASLC